MRISYSKFAAFLALIVVAYMTSTAVKDVPSIVGAAVAGYDRALVEHASHPLEDGSETLVRDPFAKPGDAVVDADGKSISAGGAGELRLTGVVFSGRRRIAYINGKRLHEGERVGTFIVKRIEFNRVSVSDGGGSYDLWLNASSLQTAKPSPSGRGSSHRSIAGQAVAEFPEVLADPNGSDPGAGDGG